MNIGIVTGRISWFEINTTNSGTRYCKFNIASKRNNDTTDFIPCIAFGHTVDTIEKYSFVGQMIAVNGSYQSGSYEKDGQTFKTLDLKVDRLDILQWDKNDDDR